jgi:hypothetical protein
MLECAGSISLGFRRGESFIMIYCELGTEGVVGAGAGAGVAGAVAAGAVPVPGAVDEAGGVESGSS